MVSAKLPLLIRVCGVTGLHPQGFVRGIHFQASRLREVLVLRDDVVGLQERQGGLRGAWALAGLRLRGHSGFRAPAAAAAAALLSL